MWQSVTWPRLSVSKVLQHLRLSKKRFRFQWSPVMAETFQEMLPLLSPKYLMKNIGHYCEISPRYPAGFLMSGQTIISLRGIPSRGLEVRYRKLLSHFRRALCMYTWLCKTYK